MSLSNISKTAATLVALAKQAIGKFFLLKEDGYYLLQETGDKIILEESQVMTNLDKTTA